MNSIINNLDQDHLENYRDQLVLSLIDLKKNKQISEELFDKKIDEVNKFLINLFIDLKMTVKVDQELHKTIKQENENLKLLNKKLEEEISQLKNEIVILSQSLSHKSIDEKQIDETKLTQLNKEDSSAEIVKLKRELHDLRKEDLELINEERDLRTKAEESFKQERENFQNQLNFKSQIADEAIKKLQQIILSTKPSKNEKKLVNEIKKFSDITRSRSNVSTLKSKLQNHLNTEEENQNLKPRSKSIDKFNLSRQISSNKIFKKQLSFESWLYLSFGQSINHKRPNWRRYFVVLDVTKLCLYNSLQINDLKESIFEIELSKVIEVKNNIEETRDAIDKVFQIKFESNYTTQSAKHNFLERSYRVTTNCDYCKKPCWNIFNPPSVLTCQICDYKIHPEHLNNEFDMQLCEFKVSANKINLMCISEAEKLTWIKRIHDNLAEIKKESNNNNSIVAQKSSILLRNDF